MAVSLNDWIRIVLMYVFRGQSGSVVHGRVRIQMLIIALTDGGWKRESDTCV